MENNNSFNNTADNTRGGLHIPMPRFSESNPADQAMTSAMMKVLRSVRSAASPAPASPTELERQRRSQQVLAVWPRRCWGSAGSPLI